MFTTLLALVLSLMVKGNCTDGRVTLFEDMSYRIQPESRTHTCLDHKIGGGEESIAVYTITDQGTYTWIVRETYDMGQPFPESIVTTIELIRINTAQ